MQKEKREKKMKSKKQAELQIREAFEIFGSLFNILNK